MQRGYKSNNTKHQAGTTSEKARLKISSYIVRVTAMFS